MVLFLGRWVPELTGHPWPLLLVLAFNVLLLALALWLGKRVRLHLGWFTLLLLLYLPYPYPDWRVAVGIAGFSLALYLSRITHHTLLNILTFIGFLTLYIITLAPDVLPADNGEFQLVAATLGVAHPPGYPLHTLLGWLMAQLPIGAIPWRINLLSALLAAGTLALVSVIVRRLTGRTLAGLAAALALGTSTTFWAQATQSNVRTLAAFFTALCVYALVRRSRPISLFAASFTLGLFHHLSLAFIGLFFIAYLLLVDPQLVRQPRRWARPALVALLCLLPLLYLPLASEKLRTLNGFVQHALALGFSGDFFYYTAPAELLARLLVMGNVLAFQFHPLILLGGAAGALMLLWKDRRLALLLIGGFTLHTLITATYRAPQTVEYMLPAYVLFVLILGYGLGQISKSQITNRKSPIYQFTNLPACFLIAAALIQGIQHYPSYFALAQGADARDYATPILGNAPHGAVVLADWHWVTPLRYLQQVEGARPDLSIQYVAPTAEPYEQTWARRIREELSQRPVVVTHFHELAYTEVPAVFEPLGEAFLVRAEPGRQLPAGYTPLHLTFGNLLTVVGVSPPPAEGVKGGATFTLAWSPAANPMPATTLFVHLIGRDGALYAQQDTALDARFLAPGDVALTQFRLEPRPGALPGRYRLKIGAYTAAGPIGERVELLSLELGPAPGSLFTQRPRAQPLSNGLTLTGVDWDLTLPQQPRLYLHWRAQRDTTPLTFTLSYDDTPLASGITPALPAGSYQTTVHTFSTLPGRLTLTTNLVTFIAPWSLPKQAIHLPAPRPSEQYLPFGSGIIYLGFTPQFTNFPIPNTQYLHFAASYPIQRDIVVSTALIGVRPDKSWTWRDLDDGVPAMGAIPTLKWIANSRVTDPHTLTVPPAAPAGQVIGALTLYDAFTGRKLPLLDERLAAVAPWAPLGEWNLSPFDTFSP